MRKVILTCAAIVGFTSASAASELGIASYYQNPHYSGLIAAHKTLPLGDASEGVQSRQRPQRHCQDRRSGAVHPRAHHRCLARRGERARLSSGGPRARADQADLNRAIGEGGQVLPLLNLRAGSARRVSSPKARPADGRPSDALWRGRIREGSRCLIRDKGAAARDNLLDRPPQPVGRPERRPSFDELWGEGAPTPSIPPKGRRLQGRTGRESGGR